MYLSKRIYLASAVLLSPLIAQAADICTYTSRSCIGSYGCCTGVAAGTCCYWGQPSGYGWSVKWQNMPAGWFGNSYGDAGCSTSTGGTGNSGTSGCLSVYTGPTYLNWGSANWVISSLTRREDSEVVGRDNCVRPDVLGYTDADGVEHSYKVPEDKFDEALAAIEAEDFAALDAYEKREVAV